MRTRKLIALVILAAFVAGSAGVVVAKVGYTLYEDHLLTRAMFEYLNKNAAAKAQPQVPTITPVPDPPKKEK